MQKRRKDWSCGAFDVRVSGHARTGGLDLADNAGGVMTAVENVKGLV